MIRVRKIAHASYEMPDLEQQVAYYTDILGLTLTAKEKDAAYLANAIDHHAVVLRGGPEVKCVHIGFQLGPDDELDAFEKQTAAHGIKTARRKDSEPTISDMVTFEDPKGTVIEVFKRPEPAPQKFQRAGVVPHKLGHVAFHVADVKGVTNFYCDVLGFRVSDWLGDFMCFLRCNSAHHRIAILPGPPCLNHVAYDMLSVDDMMCGASRLRQRGTELRWGPGRHTAGNNAFSYFTTPNGFAVEYTADLEEVDFETHQPTVHVPGPRVMDQWGIGLGGPQTMPHPAPDPRLFQPAEV